MYLRYYQSSEVFMFVLWTLMSAYARPTPDPSCESVLELLNYSFAAVSLSVSLPISALMICEPETANIARSLRDELQCKLGPESGYVLGRLWEEKMDILIFACEHSDQTKVIYIILPADFIPSITSANLNEAFHRPFILRKTFLGYI